MHFVFLNCIVPNNVFIDKTFVQLKKYNEDIKLSETHFLLNN